MTKKRSRQEKTCVNIEKKSLDINIAEEELKLERIRRIMEQEAAAAEIELQRKKNLLAHDLRIQEITMEHTRRMHELEYRQAVLKTELSELQVRKEKETEN